MVKNFLRILVCPLDWGIGHATRCVPVIRQLLKENHEVIIAADGRPLDFLREYFPELEFIRLPGARISYPPGNKMILKMAAQSPFIIFSIYKEHGRLKKIINSRGIDVVISDNRFGLWSKEIYSVYMTHQVMIKAPERMKWAEPLLRRFHSRFIRQYDACWVPDVPGMKNLSGDLGHKYPLPANARYVGILSRFDNNDESTANDLTPSPDLLVLLSGPEPQRSIMENKVLKELELHRGLHAVMLQGLPGKVVQSSPLPGVVLFNHLADPGIMHFIRNSAVIVCRPGYSTLMDLVTLCRGAVLVPTPGQTEQEYLARHLAGSGAFHSIEQEKFSLKEALEAGMKLKKPEGFDTGGQGLVSVIKALERKR